MGAVSDTSPLHYLILIQGEHVLPQLFGEVVIPEDVQQELLAPGAPVAVAEWLRRAPAWLRISARMRAAPDEDLDKLGSGERAAIALCLQNRASNHILIIDE